MNPVILCIETSTTMCSVAICDVEKIIASKEINAGYTHAENLHVFIDEVLKSSGLSKKDLSAIAVGKGPGSYTGLRIGVSAAKGMAYALEIPLIGVNSLYNMAVYAQKSVLAQDVIFCPMLDARRMEVYTAMYSNTLEEIKSTNALVVDEQSTSVFNTGKHPVFFGDGMPKCKELLEKIPGAIFVDNILPSAINMQSWVVNAYKNKQFEDVAYFEPFYLKEFFTGAK